MENSCIQKEKSTPKSVINVTPSHILPYLCTFPVKGLIPAPLCKGSVLDILSPPHIMESLSFHPHSRRKLYQVVSLSLNLFPPSLLFCAFFSSSLASALHFHYTHYYTMSFSFLCRLVEDTHGHTCMRTHTSKTPDFYFL